MLKAVMRFRYIFEKWKKKKSTIKKIRSVKFPDNFKKGYKNDNLLLMPEEVEIIVWFFSK